MQDKNLTSKQTSGDRVRERRRVLGLTQRQLAEKVGLSPGAIGRMESERAYVTSRPTMIALAQALFCNPDWLDKGVGGWAIAHEPTREDLEALHQRNLKLMASFNSLPPSARSALNEATLAATHYKDMETLLDMALQSRVPFVDREREKEFQWFLRQWGRKMERGRAALLRATDLLWQLSSLLAGAQIAEIKGRGETTRH